MASALILIGGKMKVTNGTHTVETTEFLKNIWIREGYKVVEEMDELKEELTYLELKTLAKEKGINTHGMKKEDILESLGM